MIPVVARTVEEIPIGLIDDPVYLMRNVVENDAFTDLRESIRVNGVQQAIIVERAGERYKLIAGMRRLSCCRQLGATTVPCDVRAGGESDNEAIKIIENDEREKANPAEVALYLARLFVERCDNDVDKLCALTHRTRRYVEDRLVLFDGDQQVFDALRARQISLGVALELNLIRDVGYRRLHLDNALRFGMTVAAATANRRDANRTMELSASRTDTADGAAPALSGPAHASQVCYVCVKDDHPEKMRWIIVHEHCQLAILERLVAPFRQAESEVPSA